MISAKQRAILEKADCEIAFDNLTCQLYATDASMYRIEPGAVAFPRTPAQAASVMQAAMELDVPLTPRGAGTGLVGGALGDGLIVEFARFNRQISDLNIEQGSVRVGAGVVLDQLNAYLKPRGYGFGPDVATSSRATFGGMIANNSSGANVPFYGCVADHVRSLEVVLADGKTETLGPVSTIGKSRTLAIQQRVAGAAGEIRRRMPAELLKRWPGYGLDRFLIHPEGFHHLIAGSEGTLAAILSAEVKIVPLPKRKSVGLIFFASVADAMEATVALLDLKAAAIEHIDRILFDQTRGQLAFKAARDLLELDTKPCEAILLVEFYDDNGERLRAVSERGLGLRTLLLEDAPSMNLVWGLRKAGLSLLTGRKGDAKPVTAIEDTCVRPEHLPAYVAGLQSILQRRNIEACFYGHASAGLLHVRPVLDMHSAEDLAKFRQISDEVADLVREFKGSLTGEHGVGMARAEYLPSQIGEELVTLMRDIKRQFDPKGLLNPGKIIPDGRYKIDTHLRMGASYKLSLPFEPAVAFAVKDNSFVANLEQCNGCGGCRKETVSMCPTFLATGEELMSTRGRANTIRAALELRGAPGTNPLLWEGLEAALSSCLSCKACATECPSNVNLPLLKASLMHARHQENGVPIGARVFGAVDLLGRIGCTLPSLANASLKWPVLRQGMQAVLGISSKRTLPPYATERFDQWFAQQPSGSGKRGTVLLWDDTFVRYHEPNIGKAAVTLLQAAGFRVELVSGRKCCGRPAFSQGDLDTASKLGRHNLALLQKLGDHPILFLEPSCYSMFVDDYLELRLPGAAEVKKRCFLLEKFLDDQLAREPMMLAFQSKPQRVVIHGHCHAKSLLNTAFMSRLLERIPGCKAVLLDTGCCGMAGGFGMMASKYDLSLQIAEPLVKMITAQPAGTIVVASGTSCRHQISHLCRTPAKHAIEVLAEALTK